MGAKTQKSINKTARLLDMCESVKFTKEQK